MRWTRRPSRELNGTLLAYPVQHTRCPPGLFALPLLPLQEISLIHLRPQPMEHWGRTSFSFKKNLPMSTFPPACSPDGSGAHPLSNYLWLCEMSSHGISVARSYVGQHVGLSTSTSRLLCPPKLPEQQAQGKPSRADGNFAGLVSECQAGSGYKGDRPRQPPCVVDRGSSSSITVSGSHPQRMLPSLPGLEHEVLDRVGVLRGTELRSEDVGGFPRHMSLRNTDLVCRRESQ